jgi:hypothetical protein
MNPQFFVVYKCKIIVVSASTDLRFHHPKCYFQLPYYTSGCLIAAFLFMLLCVTLKLFLSVMEQATLSYFLTLNFQYGFCLANSSVSLRHVFQAVAKGFLSLQIKAAMT